MSRRTETAYKAQSPGKSAQDDKAPGSGDRVNAVRLRRMLGGVGAGGEKPPATRFAEVLDD